MQDGASDAFFQGDWSGCMMPHRTHVLAQAPSALAMLVFERDVLILPCRQLGFDLAHPLQRLIPAPLPLPGHSAIGGSNPVVLPPGVVNIILDFVQGQF
jgi:hypothetical protein